MKRLIILFSFLYATLSFGVMDYSGGYLRLYQVNPTAGMVISANADVTLSSTNNTILANAFDANKNITLPSALSALSALSAVGRVYKISRTDENLSTVVSILPNGTDTIGGSVLYTLFAQHQFIEITSDGINAWFIAGEN